MSMWELWRTAHDLNHLPFPAFRVKLCLCAAHTRLQSLITSDDTWMQSKAPWQLA